MSNLLSKIIRISILLTVFISAQPVFAQGISAIGSQVSDLSIQLSPTSPRAGETVALELVSYSIDLDITQITWYVDGSPRTSGLGVKQTTVTAKGGGQSTAIRAVVETVGGGTKETSIQIIPAGVDLVIEPQSYTPPFYKGKPLFINQGTMRVVALPDVIIAGKKVDSRNLIFKWQKDGTMLSANSGAGKDTLIVEGTIPVRDISIGVTVFNTKGESVASGAKIISAVDPKILFYENSPLYGTLFNKAVTGNYYLGQREELTIVAKPYFFDIGNDSDTDATYRWLVNGNPVTAAGKANELLLRQTTSNLKGTASISLSVNNVMRIFQFTDNHFDVSFGI